MYTYRGVREFGLFGTRTRFYRFIGTYFLFEDCLGFSWDLGVTIIGRVPICSYLVTLSCPQVFMFLGLHLGMVLELTRRYHCFHYYGAKVFAWGLWWFIRVCSSLEVCWARGFTLRTRFTGDSVGKYHFSGFGFWCLSTLFTLLFTYSITIRATLTIRLSTRELCGLCLSLIGYVCRVSTWNNRRACRFILHVNGFGFTPWEILSVITCLYIIGVGGTRVL